MSSKLLVLGASGGIGRAVADRLGPSGCVATWNSRPIDGGLRFDAMADQVESLGLDGIDAALVLLGNTNPESCARDLPGSWALNVDALCRLCDQLGARGIRTVFTSSEAVFDGRKGSYVETDEACPIMAYGRQKREVEEHLAQAWPDAVQVRIARVYGAYPGDGSLLDGWARQALAGDTIRAAEDFFSSVVHADDVVDALISLAKGDFSGLYHLGGPRSVSRFEMCRLLVMAMREKDMTVGEVVPCSIDDFPTLEGRPHDISLSSAKLAAAIGFAPRSVEQSIADFVSRLGGAR